MSSHILREKQDDWQVRGGGIIEILSRQQYGTSDQFMNRRLAAEMSRLCVENLGDSTLLPALFALIRNISPRHPSSPELIRGSIYFATLAALTRTGTQRLNTKFIVAGLINES